VSFKGIIRGDPDTESLKNYLFKFGRAGFPHKLSIFLYLTNAEDVDFVLDLIKSIREKN